MDEKNLTSQEIEAMNARLEEIKNSRDTINDDLRLVVGTIEEKRGYIINGVQIDPVKYQNFLLGLGATLEGPEEPLYSMASKDPRFMFGGECNLEKVSLVRCFTAEEIFTGSRR